MDKARNGYRLGDGVLIDGLLKDGLTDVYNKVHMGVCAEKCADEMSFSREEQDEFALTSYDRSAAAWSAGKFNDEVIPVEVPQRRGDALIVSEDEEYKNINKEKFLKLRTVFKKDGTVTAGNASTINDGASALILMSSDKALELGITLLLRLIHLLMQLKNQNGLLLHLLKLYLLLLLKLDFRSMMWIIRT